MLYRKSTLTLLLLLIFLSFFGMLAVSAWTFPQNYDWRYRVISNLLSPRDNPDHYRMAAGSVVLTGVFMLPFAGYLRRSLRPIAPRASDLSGLAFAIGTTILICAALVVPQHAHATLGIRRMHELLGRSAAAFLAIGMLGGCWCAWKARSSNLSAAWLFAIWSAITLLPLTGILCSESLLLLTRFQPLLGSPIRDALRHSVFWHLGFWEWTGAVAVFAFLCTTVLFTPSELDQHRES